MSRAGYWHETRHSAIGEPSSPIMDWRATSYPSPYRAIWKSPGGQSQKTNPVDQWGGGWYAGVLGNIVADCRIVE
jgi:hypothetical protein